MTQTRAEFSDADLAHPWLERYRIPVVESPYPVWKYEVALVAPSELWRTTEATEEEAAVVGSVIDYRMTYYNDHWAAKMRERILDVDATTNTLILAKYKSGWAYRRATFETGTWPYHNTPAQMAAQFTPDVAGLVRLLDKIYTYGDSPASDWINWKASHPSVFAHA